MKKSYILIISLIIFLFIFNPLTFVLAQDEIPSGALPFSPEKVEQTTEQIKTQNTTYLKQEWKDMFADNKYLSPIVSVIDKITTFLNPFFKLILGVESSLSWVFIFAIGIWIILFFIIYQSANLIFDKKLFAIIAAFIIASLVGLSGAIKKAVDLLETAIKNPWIAIISLVITIIIIIIIIIFGGGLKKTLKKAKEKEAKRKLEENQKIIQTSADVERKKLEESYG